MSRSTKPTLERIPWLDHVRAIAILLVVANHTIERTYSLTAAAMAQYSFQGRLFALSIFTLGRMGVPLFFFLSGYLLLDRPYDRERTRGFYRRNVGGLLVTTELWILLYNLFNRWFYDRPLELGTLVKNLLFLQNTAMSHMWFLPALLGIYLFLPLVANGLQRTDPHLLYLPMLVAFCFLYVLPECNVLLKIGGNEIWTPSLDVSFSGGTYGFYLLVGYLVKKGTFTRWPAWALGTVGATGFLFTVLLQMASYARSTVQDVHYNVWYSNATLFLGALAIFLLFSKGHRTSLTLSNLSQCSFGIYLLHNPINLVLFRVLSFPRRPVQFFVIFLFTLALAWLLTGILQRQRRISQLFLFRKSDP